MRRARRAPSTHRPPAVFAVRGFRKIGTVTNNDQIKVGLQTHLAAAQLAHADNSHFRLFKASVTRGNIALCGGKAAKCCAAQYRQIVCPQFDNLSDWQAGKRLCGTGCDAHQGARHPKYRQNPPVIDLKIISIIARGARFNQNVDKLGIARQPCRQARGHADNIDQKFERIVV